MDTAYGHPKMNKELYKALLTDIPFLIGSVFALSAFAYTFFDFKWWYVTDHDRSFFVALFHIGGIIMSIFRYVIILDEAKHVR